MFNWVEDHGQDSVSCKWAFTEKQKENGSKMVKARLVAWGFEEKNMNENHYIWTKITGWLPGGLSLSSLRGR